MWTGVEAVSNGVAAFREPRVTHRTRNVLTAIIAILAVLLVGIAYLCQAQGESGDRTRQAGATTASCRSWSPRLPVAA